MRSVGVVVAMGLLAWGVWPRDGPAARGEADALHLAFEPARHTLAPRRRGARRVVELPWVCHGRGVLRVPGVRGDCACARVGRLPSEVRGGARGTLRVELAATSRAGPQRIVVRAFTNLPPPHDVARVRLDGWVGSPGRVAPVRLDLGALTPAHVVTRVIDLHVARAPSTVQVAVEGVVGEGRRLPTRVHDPWGTARCAVQVRLRAPRTPGAFAGRVVMRVPEVGQWHVPIVGTVVVNAPGFGRGR